MGATPLGYLMTTALPRDLPADWLGRFVDGLAAGPGGIRPFGAGRRHGLDARADLAVADHPRHAWRPGRRCGAPGRGRATSSGCPAPSATGRSGCGCCRAGWRAMRPGTWPAATGCRGRGWRWAQALAGLARAAMDVSDGLVQDLGHLCRAGGCGAVLRAAAVPLSPAARALVVADPALAGALPDRRRRLRVAVRRRAGGRGCLVAARAAAAGTPVTRIGQFRAGAAEVRVLDAARAPMALPRGGWSHF